jgi:exopolysaccharide biosynthesis polyprenyl glycosylphosphotransferase
MAVKPAGPLRLADNMLDLERNRPVGILIDQKNSNFEPHRKGQSRLAVTPIPRHYGALPEESFVRVLGLERKRTERSQKPFLLMLLDAEKILQMSRREPVLRRVIGALESITRETDIVGWYKDKSVAGVIFTEVALAEDESIPDAILARVNSHLQNCLGSEDFERVDISLQIFPDEWNSEGPEPPAKLDLYPDLSETKDPRKVARFLKRAMDICGSLAALIILLPVYLAVAVAIKLTSEGPIFFRQARVGRYGKKFTLFKFRTMKVSNNPSIHKEFIKQFIAESSKAGKDASSTDRVYKIQQDPRITRVGSFLRKTSLDEFPQFFNVLIGDMSLVGPRPPIPYECELYSVWHRRRVLEAKPGITGLWQVNGRSKTRFDEMVRLDLRYAKSWSLWLDIKILFRTPFAVFIGDGAY